MLVKVALLEIKNLVQLAKNMFKFLSSWYLPMNIYGEALGQVPDCILLTGVVSINATGYIDMKVIIRYKKSSYCLRFIKVLLPTCQFFFFFISIFFPHLLKS